jgi:hypothetical protein
VTKAFQCKFVVDPAILSETVYVNTIRSAYNSQMRVVCRACFTVLLVVVGAWAQDARSLEPLSVITKDLPAASLWQTYNFSLRAGGGVGPHRWRIISGSLPTGLKLEEFGKLEGVPQESGQFEFTVLVTGNGKIQTRQKLTLPVETPFSVEWGHRALVNGQRIEGSVKVSNRTGRDLDFTFIVLAVNDIGRATAIGYQHFPLKKNTRDFELPFGDTLSPGSYAVNVDAVGEEPVSNRIFRARLVTGRKSVTQGP